MAGPQWLESIKEISGLDPLGVQAISQNIYGYLLPGMTNVTSRLRYYTFLCWVLFNYSKKIKSKKLEDWYIYLRKAEFLFALITDMHHIDEIGYYSAMVGSEKTRQLLRNNNEEVIHLTEYTKFEDSPQRYFQNKGGGFSQYYQGSMKQLKLIVDGGPLNFQLADNISKTKEVRYGIQAVNVFLSNSLLDLFHECIITEKVTRTQLREMGDSLCACNIVKNNNEHKLLTDLLFNIDNYFGDEGDRRKNTLNLILNLIKNNKYEGITIDDFRDICMYGYYPDASELRIKPNIKEILEWWKIYQMHEYFSFSLQSLFYLFEKIIDEIKGNFEKIFAYIQGEMLLKKISDIPSLEAFSIIDFNPDINFKKFLEYISFSNDDEVNWNTNKVSEHYLKLQVFKYIKEDNLAAILYSALIILGKIYLKTFKIKNFYRDINIDLYNTYRININYLNLFIKNSINDNLWVFINKILREFVVERHVIVALRKLRYVKRSTIRYVLENQEYTRCINIGYDMPVDTSPRLFTAFRFLEDLDFIKKTNENKYVLKDNGLKFMDKDR